MNKEQPKLYGLDHLRALAILLVLLFHYLSFGHPQWANVFADTGWTGVDLFFVLSGFLIASQLFAQIKKGNPVSLKEFFLKRLFRIIPVYLVIVAIYFCIPFFREKEALPSLWRFLTFTQNFGLDRGNYGAFSHAWSLCVEEHFYLFLPFTLVFLQFTKSFKRAYWILIILFIAGFVLRFYSWHYLYLPNIDSNTKIDYWAMYSYYPTYNRLDGLLIGVSIAGVYQFLPAFWQRIAKYGNWLILLGVVILALCFQFCSKLYEYNTSIYGYTLISIGYGFMVAGALSPVSFLYKWKSSITTLIATLSYGMYLSHKGIIHMTQVVFGDWGIDKNSTPMLLISVALSITGAWLLHLAIEKPFMKWRDVVLKKKYLPLLLFFMLPFICNAQVKVLYNARIFTADVQHPYAEAIAIKGKKIIAVGNNAEVKKLAGVAAKQIDCNGNFLMPGFIDSHNHGINGGRGLTKANTSDRLISINELVVYAKSSLQKKERLTGDVLVIYGINISTWAHLDELILEFNKDEFTVQPVVLRGSDGHTSWTNQAMMKRAKLDEQFIQSLPPEDKIYYGTTKEGAPNGFVSEKGIRTITSKLVVETDFSKAAEKTMEYNNGLGITAFLDPTVSTFNNTRIDYMEWYAYLRKNGKLTAHIAGCVVPDLEDDPQHQISMLKALQKKYNAENFSIIGFKIFGDGVSEHPTHTAALSLPYTGTSSKGVLMFDPKKFERFAIAADKQNLLVHVHAIGDRAVTETLNVFEAVRKANGNNKIPHSITHLQIVLPSDFERFAKLNILASYQLLWAFGDVTTIDIVKPYIHPSLYKWQYPARSMLQAGATICGASDWSVSSANPFEAIYHAETRRGPMGVLDSTQCMPRLDMLYAYTINAAKAMMAEKTIGSLVPGKSADIIMLDRDILTVTPEAMKETRVLWTMFQGKKVYEAWQR